ncbi:hypothetical protein ABB29_01455 [Pseudoxanthomonas dokdonensis]|uniref:Uncharacterized protein n=1 Tax=Pseudoxanthomonas dokdonensis TaxID=344882 RepID=A0A0R0CQK0_9GAMM|nr:hypothetical protein ABB29_01455 [Pseudoxanthomonas dokdonensis]
MALTILLLLVLLVVLLRQPLADRLWPQTRAQALLVQGRQALAEGRLDDPAGHGARQYFEAAQALDNDRGDARAGLAEVAVQALQQARTALAGNDLAQAQRSLALARDLQVPREQADAVAAELRRAQADAAGIDDLLLRADQAREQGRLVGATDAALPLYQRILVLQPDLMAALEGREDALSDLLQPLDGLLQHGQLAEAAALISQVEQFDPGHVALPEARAQLATLIQQQREQADRQLAQDHIAQAASGYRAILAVDPNDSGSRQGLQRAAMAKVRQAQALAADFQFKAANAALEQATELAPGLAAIAEGRRELASLQASAKQRVPRADPARLDQLLARMQQAEARGDWLSPPGESAYDALRSAQAIAPDDARVRLAATRLLPNIRGCFEHELQQNRIGRSQACLQAWQSLAPMDAGLASGKRRLAQKWVAVGNEQLGAGDLAFANRAMREAMALDANAAGVADFASRVRSANAGGGRR